MVNSNPSDLKRFYEHPPFFLFCYESQLSLDKIKQNIEAFVAEKSIDNLQVLDAVFVLGKGWIINLGDGQGAFQFRTPDGKTSTNWIIQIQTLFYLISLATCL